MIDKDDQFITQADIDTGRAILCKCDASGHNHACSANGAKDGAEQTTDSSLQSTSEPR